MSQMPNSDASLSERTCSFPFHRRCFPLQYRERAGGGAEDRRKEHERVGSFRKQSLDFRGRERQTHQRAHQQAQGSEEKREFNNCFGN